MRKKYPLFILLLAAPLLLFPTISSAEITQQDRDEAYERVWKEAFKNTSEASAMFNSTTKENILTFGDYPSGYITFIEGLMNKIQDDAPAQANLDLVAPFEDASGKTRRTVIEEWRAVCNQMEASRKIWADVQLKEKEYQDLERAKDPTYEFGGRFTPGAAGYDSVRNQFLLALAGEGTKYASHPCLIAAANIGLATGIIEENNKLIPFPKEDRPLRSTIAKGERCFVFIETCQPALRKRWTTSPDSSFKQNLDASNNIAKETLKQFEEILVKAPPPAPVDFSSELDKGSVVGLSLPLSDRSIPELINKVVSQILSIVGALGLVGFIYGGILYMTASGNTERAEKGRKAIVWSTLGLVVIFAAYAIVKFITDALVK